MQLVELSELSIKHKSSLAASSGSRGSPEQSSEEDNPQKPRAEWCCREHESDTDGDGTVFIE